jgi:hypothetical protein
MGQAAPQRGQASIAVVWERRSYRQRASFRIQYTPDGPAAGRLVVSQSRPQGWRPPTLLTTTEHEGTQTCYGLVADGQSLWVRINTTREECLVSNWLVYAAGELSQEGTPRRLTLQRAGPHVSWEREQARLARASVLVCGAALLLVLAALVALPLSPALRQMAWVSAALLLWQGGSTLLFRRRFRLSRVLPALCILVTGVLYLALSLFPHLPF